MVHFSGIESVEVYHPVPKVAAFCGACGKGLSFYPSQPQRFCSRACDIQWRRLTNQPRKPRRGTTTPCETCGAPVYANASQRAKGQGRFCSRNCHNIGQTKAKPRTCRVCGGEMRRPPSQEHITVCSRLCEANGRIRRPLDRIHNGRPAKLDNYGYVMLWEPDHPNKTLKGWQYEHRLVVEKALGRYLTTQEQVDHINGIKNDNRPENLQVLTIHEHSSKTSLTSWNELREYRKRYGALN